MGFFYFGAKNKWINITRDERFFCAHLYCKMIADLSPFLELLYEKSRGFEKKIISSEEIKPDSWEVGFEVCFFRDYVFEFGDQNANKSLKKSEFSANPYDKSICTDCDWRRLCRAPHLN